MGQYHIVVNLDKFEFLDPHKLGDGSKVWEQLNPPGGTVAALFLLMLAACKGGPRGGGDPEYHPLIGAWAGDCIAVIGDYCYRTDLPTKRRADLVYKACMFWQCVDGKDLQGANEWLDSIRKRHLAAGEKWVKAHRFRDISDQIKPVVERECGLRIPSNRRRK